MNDYRFGLTSQSKSKLSFDFTTEGIMNSLQSRMARAALKMGVRDIALAAKVSTQTITRLESGEELKERTLDDIRRAYEEAGAKFIDDGEWVGTMVMKEPSANL